MSAPSAFTLSKNRLEALSDGIFAIAMTLLVLEIKVPTIAKQDATTQLLYAIVQEGPAFFGFFITFLFCGMFWYFHHMTLRYEHQIGPQQAVTNLFFLALISLLPFSTGLLSHYMKTSAAQGFYFCNLIGISLFLATHWTLSQRSMEAEGVVLEADQARIVRLMSARLYVLPLAYAFGLVISQINTQWSFYGVILVMLVSRAWRKRSERRG